MKYAKRMVLVPELEYLATCKPKRKTQTKRQQAQNITQKLAKQIRQRQHTTARLRTHGRKRVDPGVNLSSVYVENEANMDTSEIVDHIPVMYRNKATLLLAHLTKQGMTWNDRKEVFLPGGTLLHNSNIVDLVKEALVKGTKAKPRGWNEFLASMAATGVPVSLFTKQSTIQGLQREQPTWDDF